MGTRSVRVTALCLMSVCVLVLSGTGLASAAPGSGDVAGPVDVGGRRVWLECHGPARPGVPTVVFMSGYGSAGDIWDVVDPALTPPPEPVAPALARELRVCSYDRPQTLRADDAITTRSDPVAQPRTARDWASELGALLTAARVPGPFVLVAHSFSGLAARLYAAEHPQQIAGLVMVDATSEELRDLLTPAQQAFFSAPSPLPGVEQLDWGTSLEEVVASTRAHPHPPTLPTWVLSAGVIDLPPNVPDGARVVDAQRTAQRDLATSQLPGSVHAIADRSDHNIHVRQPELVVDAARDVVARATLPAAPSANVSWGWLALAAVLGALVALAVGALLLRTRRARGPDRDQRPGASDGASITSSPAATADAEHPISSPLSNTPDRDPPQQPPVIGTDRR